jgi:hypothetical protein
MYNLSRFCCQNPKCADYGKRGAGNLSANKPYGKGKMQRLLYCRTCKRRFSARKGTVFFGCRLPDKKMVEILDHLAEGCGMRKTARLTGRSRNAVGHVLPTRSLGRTCTTPLCTKPAKMGAWYESSRA